MSDSSSTAQRDERLERVLADYLHAVEAGQPPERAALLAQHPDLAAELDSFLRNRDAIERIAEPIKRQVPDAETIGVGHDAAAANVVRYFGDYEIVQEIARGGMGMVFQARQVSLNRIVAVKMILAGQLAAPADVARFRAEAEAAGKLDHPHIVPIYEIGEHDGQHYFSMKFIEGSSLAARRIATPQAAEAAMLVATVARAVHHAHQRGILHRDLKPGNILLDGDGRPHVTDFGLARRVESDSALTQSGAIVGTPSYMAPEQARSEKQLTTAADIYSLGAILYELLTGAPPFRAATPLETLLQVVEHEPARPRALNPRVPRDLETICLKCLEKDPRRRYGSAEALADDLERWRAGEAITARQTATWERAVKWARRQPAVAALVCVSAAAILLLVVGLVVVNARIRAEQQITEDALSSERAASAARAKAEAALRASLRSERTASYANRLALANAEWHDHHVELATHALDRCPLDLRNWEWHYLNRLCRSASLSVPSFGLTVAYSPDGKYLVTGAPNTEQGCGVWLFDAATGKQLRRFDGLHNHLCHVAFSADGRLLAGASNWRLGNGGVAVWEVATGKVLFTRFAPTSYHGMALSPDGQRLFLSERGSPGKQAVNGYRIADGTRFLSIPDDLGRALNPIALSGDGQRLALATGIYDARTGKALIACEGLDKGGVEQLLFSPDGRRLAAAAGDAGIVVWNAESGKRALSIPTRPVIRVAFSPDNKRLAAGSKTDLRLLDADTGTELFALHNVMSRTITGIAFSPDGTHVAASGLMNEPVKVLNLAAREAYLLQLPPRQLAENGWDPDDLVFHPDGRTAASIVGQATSVIRFDLVTARELDTLRLPSARPDEKRILRIVYRPDGRLLALVAAKAKDHSYGIHVRDLTARRTLFTVREQGVADISESTFDRWVNFNADGTRLAMALRGAERVELWDVDRGKAIGGLPTGTYRGGVLQLSPDGRWATVLRMRSFGTGKDAPPKAGPGAMGMQLYNAETGKLVYESASTLFCFNAASKLLALYGKDDAAIIVDIETGKEIHVLRGAGLVMAFSPDGKRLATVKHVWDALTGQPICDWSINLWSNAVFSPDASRVALLGHGFAGDQLELWDPATGQQTFTIRGLPYKVSRIYFRRDGRRLLTMDHASQVRSWDATPVQ